MSYRGNMSKSSNFSAWMEEKQRLTAQEEDPDLPPGDEGQSYFGRLFSIQNDIAAQIEGFQGSLPESGPMSAAFRARVINSIYLLFAALFFAVMAVLVGIPTIILKPTKFVTCVSLATICVIASIAVMQKPTVFFQNIFRNGVSNALPMISLITCLFGTIFIVVFKRSYLWTIIALCMQTLSMLWFLASFIPGGAKGLQVILKAGYVLIKTALTPIIFVCRKTVETFINRLFS